MAYDFCIISYEVDVLYSTTKKINWRLKAFTNCCKSQDLVYNSNNRPEQATTIFYDLFVSFITHCFISDL